MLVGQQQSGKTSLKNVLTGNVFDQEEFSTTRIKANPSYFKVTREVWKVGEKLQATDEQEEGKGPLFVDYEEHPFDFFNAPRPRTHEVSADKSEDKEDIFSVLWDFGGSSVYYATHPVFLTAKALYLLTYNLSLNPDERASPQVKRGLYQNVEDVFCERSNMDALEVWMSSVYSLVSEGESSQEASTSNVLPERLPPIFLVCTHADKPYKGEHPKELAHKIYRSLQTKPYGKHLADVFVVDNTKSRSGQECPEVTRLRREVLAVAKELPQMKEAIPIKWLKYENAVRNLLNNGVKWISLEKARKIAVEVCGLSGDEQFLELLDFLCDQRILIHFDDTPELNKMVILDPQWLIDVLKVITITPYERKERKFRSLWLKLEETGCLEEKLLQHAWDPLFDDRETLMGLVAMMEKFCFLCPWPSSSVGETSNEYLVPSMLMSRPKQEVNYLTASAGIPSLFVNFRSGLVPPGLFPRLILAVFQGFTKEGLCQTRPQLGHNFARFFTHPTEGCSVIFLCHSSFIEIVVHKEDCTTKICTTVLPGLNLSSESSWDTFQVALARVVSQQLRLKLECMRAEYHWLRNMTYEMSVCCPVCCKQGSVNHCLPHNVHNCKKEECLHFWSESQLRDCQGLVVCDRSVAAEDNRVPVKLFRHWFKFIDEQVKYSALIVSFP